MDIGQKQEVSLREIWPKEDKDFTPWLSENLELLGEELGIDIELIEKEHSVGSFFLDILQVKCKMGSGRSKYLIIHRKS